MNHYSSVDIEPNNSIQWRISKTGLTISFKCFSWEPLGQPDQLKIKNSSDQRNDVTKNIKFFYFNGVNVAKHWHAGGGGGREVFALSDCLVLYVMFSK